MPDRSDEPTVGFGALGNLSDTLAKANALMDQAKANGVVVTLEADTTLEATLLGLTQPVKLTAPKGTTIRIKIAGG